MTPKEYIKNVLITESRDFTPLKERFSQTRNIRLLHGAIGLASELAEIRQLAGEDEIDEINLKEEIGDIFWYVGIMSDELKVDPEDIFDAGTVLMDTEVQDSEEKKEQLNYLVDAMTVAIGEEIDLLKKSLMYGKELNTYSLTSNLLRINSYSDAALGLYGLTSAQARERNIEKLRARYGEKFTEAAALNRDIETERKILEVK